MTLIQTVSPEDADGIVKEGYDMYLEKIGIVPKPMEMMSVSPTLFGIMLNRTHYLSTHPRLSFSLLAHIRYLAAQHLSYPFCTDFNEVILRKQGLSEEDLEALKADPASTLLEEHEHAMLIFVIQSIKTPESITADHVHTLKDMGWQDGDLVDALSHGVSMIDHAIMMQVFQMDQTCMTPQA